MSSGTFYPTDISDIGSWDDGGGYHPGDYPTSFVSIGAVDYSSCVWIRFSGVDIPRGSNLSSASISLKAYSDKTEGICGVGIYISEEDDASIPSSRTEAYAKTLSSPVVWSPVPAFYDGSSYQSVDLTSILQTIISRSGWSSGSHVLFVIKNSSSYYGAIREVSNVAYLSGSEKPSLSVEWSAPTSNDLDESTPSLEANGTTGSFGVSALPAFSMNAFPLAMSGAVADMSIPALQSLQLGGEALLPVMEMAATGYEYVAGAGANGSMSLRIDNDGLGGMSCFATSAPLGEMSITAATMFATAKPGNDGVLTMPLATMTARSGSRGEVDISIPTMAAWTTNPGSGALVMTQMDMSAFVFHAGLVAQGAMKIPKAAMVAHGLVGQIGRAALGVKMTMAAHGVSGQMASGVGRMVPPVAHGLASVVSKATMAASTYQLAADGIATADSSAFSEPVVYEKEAVR